MTIEKARNNFSDSYPEARQRFLETATGAKVTSYRHPLVGSDGGELATDVVRIGTPLARNILGIGSGTHGVEGYCGSGIQTALLTEAMASDLPDDMAFVFIHAINPWGFAWDRRVNEDNVDLNRNFVDHTAPYPENPGYEDIYEAVNPADLSDETLKSGRKIMKAYIQKHGAPALQHALSGGQYTYPEGVQFGGTKPVWSNTTLRQIIRNEMSKAEHIVYIDIHSGLGVRAQGEVISTSAETSPVYKRLHALWGDIVHSTKAEGSVSSNVLGSITEAFEAELSPRKVSPCGLEFGTVEMNLVAAALVADNWLHHHGGLNNPQAFAIKKQIRDAFYIDADDWKEEVTQQSRDLVQRVLETFRDQ